MYKNNSNNFQITLFALNNNFLVTTDINCFVIAEYLPVGYNSQLIMVWVNRTADLDYFRYYLKSGHIHIFSKDQKNSSK